jgi:hypothetical protein
VSAKKKIKLPRYLYALRDEYGFQGVFSSYQRAYVYAKHRKLTGVKVYREYLDPEKRSLTEMITSTLKTKYKPLANAVSMKNPLLKALQKGKGAW